MLSPENQLLQDLKVALEDYPELKANALMQSFVDSLSRLENEVALMRIGYNDAVNQYNTRVQSFPDLVLAKWFGFTLKERLDFD